MEECLGSTEDKDLKLKNAVQTRGQRSQAEECGKNALRQELGRHWRRVSKG
jgi:hypothetical protein